ncbi:MAG TPA: putative quinol monooxygenase [Anaerovoracaceae bacterium]|nr:putative quinol monooxygenase [Anaerovoracaceae bacterium]
MIKVVANNMVKKEKIEEFISLAEKLVEATNKYDEGCIHYELYQDLNNPLLLTFIEEWESMEALDKHIAAEHFKEFVPKLGAFADGPEDVHLFKKAK